MGGSITMRLSVCSLPFLLLAIVPAFAGGEKTVVTASTPEQRQMLQKAFEAFLEHQGRWAYTETHYSQSSDGKKGPRTVIRFDPSLPFAQQRVLVERDGHAPTEKDLKAWAEEQQKYARRQEKILKSGGSVEVGADDFRIRIHSEEVVPLISGAAVVSENESSITYEIPMRRAGGTDQPLYQRHSLTARVGKRLQQFEHAELRQLALLRVGAGKYYDGLSSIDFGSPDPRFPTVQFITTNEVSNKPLFGGPYRSRSVQERSDHKHVTPYDERFGVKIGPIRTIEF